MNIKLLAALILLILSATVQAVEPAFFTKGDAKIGKKLFFENKCTSCHIDKVGGDGSGIFTRTNRKVKNAESLATQITRCTTNLDLLMCDDDEAHMGAYLNKTFYKFK